VNLTKAAVLTGLGGLLVFVACSTSQPTPTPVDPFASIVHHPSRAACDVAPPGHARCFAHVRTNADGSVKTAAAPEGLAPSDVQAAYGSSPSQGGTIAIVDAYDDPTAESDLAKYRKQYGLPACTTANGCLKKVNQNGQASPLPPIGCSTDDKGNVDAGWVIEISLDLDAVSAACPSCNIVLVEANSSSDDDLGTAAQTAAGMSPSAISLSYGRLESNQDPSQYYPGNVPTFAATGDDGYSDHLANQGGNSAAASSPTLSCNPKTDMGDGGDEAGDADDEGGDASSTEAGGDEGGMSEAGSGGDSGGSEEAGGSGEAGSGGDGGGGTAEAGGDDGDDGEEDCVNEEDGGGEGTNEDGGKDGGMPTQVSAEFPASLTTVTAVGGTTLAKDSSSSRGWAEEAWSNGGSGCSLYVDKPNWQMDKGCSKRTVGDISAVADPDTAIAVVIQSQWTVIGGTSLATPLSAATFVANGLNQLLQPGAAYSNGSNYNDVTSGSNGTCAPYPAYVCNAETGYDAPTGVGSPNCSGSGNGSSMVSSSDGGNESGAEGGKKRMCSKDSGADSGDSGDASDGDDGGNDGGGEDGGGASGTGGEGGTCDNTEKAAPAP
jgi:hypothetical protein